MKKIITETEALCRMTALCSASEQCEHKIREKLVKMGLDNSTIEKIILYLYDERYLDENRFANAYAKDKLLYNKWGRVKIGQNLRMLHVSQQSIASALDGLPETEYTSILQSLLSSKARSVKADNDYERNMKLIRFALGRGFEMQAIRQCLPDSAETDIFDF